MRAFHAAFIEDRVHGNLPQTGKLRLAVADASNTETVVGQTVVEGVRPVGISAAVTDRNTRRGARVVEETGGAESLERVNRVVEEGCTETLEIAEGNSGERVERNEVTVDLVRLGRGDVGHGVIGNLVSGDIPVGDHGVVGVVERSKVGHFWRTAVGVFAVSEELINRVDSICLDCIVARGRKSQQLC